MSLLNKLFSYVLLATNKYNIDESHGMSHSMNVLHFANKIYESEKENYPILEHHERIIYVSAILHDMCDKKYMNEDEGVRSISEFLKDDLTESELDISKQIMQTMSYSKVKVNGFPDLKEYQMAYHVVREADLLSAYDFDRCMLYNLHCQRKGDEVSILNAYSNANDLFQKRVLRHYEDGLFVTEYAKHHYIDLHYGALKRMDTWKHMIRKTAI